MQGSGWATTEPAAMKRIIMLALGLTLAFVAAIAPRTLAQAPSSSPQPVATPSRVFVVNPSNPNSFFPSSDQETGVWQGCGPAQDQGALEEFSRAHPRVRIVQVFIDASLPCKAQGAHTFVIVYQGETHVVRRSVRYPMAR